MTLRNELKSGVLQLAHTANTQNAAEQSYRFEQLALEIFRFQAKSNAIYQKYLKFRSIHVKDIHRVEQIPCLPIQFFKQHKVISGNISPQLIFESSGTTGQINSKHYVADLPFYEQLSQLTFEQFYGSLTDYHILALLPSYLERNNSSLVYMVQSFIYRSYSTEAGFYLNNTNELLQKLTHLLQHSSRKVLLIGVTFALLDLAENPEIGLFLKQNADRLVVMETGGMKGRRKELVREEVHTILKNAFGVSAIHSEYGMTELLSQGYSQGEGIFRLPPTLKIMLREVNDPLTYLPSFSIGESHKNERGKTGGINVIDLANIDSCSFIETQDLGNYTTDYQGFKIMGRFDNSDVRGCNLMVAN